MAITTYSVGIEATMAALGGKWKPIVLYHLRKKPMRTGELKRAIPQVTQKMLTQQLRELEEAGIVHREVFEQVPPKVIYSLTDYGQTLDRVLSELCEWGECDIDRRRKMGEEIELVHHDED